MVDVALAKSECSEETLTSSLQGLRLSLAEAHSEEKPLLINLGLLSPNFKQVYTDPEIWPADKIFDWEELQSQPRLLVSADLVAPKLAAEKFTDNVSGLVLEDELDTSFTSIRDINRRKTASTAHST